MIVHPAVRTPRRAQYHNARATLRHVIRLHCNPHDMILAAMVLTWPVVKLMYALNIIESRRHVFAAAIVTVLGSGLAGTRWHQERHERNMRDARLSSIPPRRPRAPVVESWPAAALAEVPPPPCHHTGEIAAVRDRLEHFVAGTIEACRDAGLMPPAELMPPAGFEPPHSHLSAVPVYAEPLAPLPGEVA